MTTAREKQEAKVAAIHAFIKDHPYAAITLFESPEEWVGNLQAAEIDVMDERCWRRLSYDEQETAELLNRAYAAWGILKTKLEEIDNG